MKRTLLFASVMAIASAFTANAQWTESVTGFYSNGTDLANSGYVQPPYTGVKNVESFSVAIKHSSASWGIGQNPSTDLASLVEVKNSENEIFTPSRVTSAGAVITVAFDSAITADGVYTVTIKPGAMDYTPAGGEISYSPEFVLSNMFTIGESTVDPEPPVDPDPTPGDKEFVVTKWMFNCVGDSETKDYTYYYEDLSNVGEFNRVQIKMAKPDDMEVSDWAGIALNYTINQDKLSEVKLTNGTDTFLPASITDNSLITLNLNYDPFITAGGTYSLSVPEGLVTFADGKISEAAELSDVFSIDASKFVASFNVYSLNPEEGEVESLNKVTVMFPKAVDLMDDDMTIVFNSELYSVTSASLKSLDGVTTGEDDEEAEAVTYQSLNIEVIDAFAAEITFPEVPAGRYQLTIPGMMFYNSADNTVMNSGIFANYTVVGAAVNPLNEYTFTPEPGKSVSELSTIAIEFKQPVKVLNENVQANDFSVVALMGNNNEYLCKNIEFAEGNDASVVFTFDPITANGTYTLVIPAGFFGVDVPGQPEGASEEIKADFIVGTDNAVETILGGAEDFTVVDLAGRVVVRNAATLSGLEPGIYVINGKKVIIRK